MNFMSMNKLACLLALVSFAAISDVGRSWLKQDARVQLDSDYLAAEEQRFIEYGRDFRAFAKAHVGRGLDYQVPANLADTASFMSQRLHLMGLLETIHESVDCKKDDLVVKRYLIREIDSDLKLMNSNIEDVNTQLSYTNTPVVAQTGMRMKDDMRDVKAKLDSIRASLE